MRSRRGGLVVLAASAALALAAPPAFAARLAPPPPGPCTTGDVVERVHTDHARYVPGRPVKITLAATNRSGHDCGMPGIVFIEVRSGSGAVVWQTGIAVDWIRSARWKAGKSLTWSATWDQRVTTGRKPVPAPPGRYRVTGAWDSYRPGAASLVVNGVK